MTGIPKNRTTAKDAVRQNWQDRRRAVQEKPIPSPSVCFTMKNTWMQLWKDFASDNKQRSPALENKRERKARTKPRPHFPSVVTMLQRNEIVRQVKTLQEEDTLKEVLSVLPTGYDWTKAIQETASKRSRAFWLLDLSVIVRNFVNLKKPRVRYIYNVHLSANSDPVLLKVLIRGNAVSLSTTTKWDIDRCKSVLGDQDDCGDLIVDSAICCGKPDGYIREWIRLPNRGPLVVNGSKEVLRINETMQRIQQRSQQPAVEIAFLLRVEGHNMECWMNTFEETARTLKECNCSLVGISLELPEYLTEEFIRNVDLFLNHMKSPKFEVDEQLRVDLRGTVVALNTNDIICSPNSWVEQLSQHENVGLVTVDVTKSLLASASALCTRVIGVREQEVDEQIRRHYYIDDGCYGSLCVKENVLTPFPLVEADPTLESYESCIWGPTCDGLDRVCQNIQLPAMKRDDWLVFASMTSGSEGLSTAFNGFDPPDTAYCVLGYFGQSRTTSS